MRSVKVTLPGATGAGTPIILDQMFTPQDVGVVFIFGAASCTVKLQWTLDDPYATYATDFGTNANWIDDKNLTSLTSITAGVPICAAGFPIPVRAVRGYVTAWTSGTATLTVVQVGGSS